MLRRLAGDDPQVNEEWNCDKGRWAFSYATAPRPPRHARWSATSDGELSRRRGPRRSTLRPRVSPRAQRPPASVCWSAAALTVEDAYAYAKFARVALGTNDIDFRARAHSAEEAALPRRARRRSLPRRRPTPTSKRRPTVLLVGLEPEEESPIIFLRLRKAAFKKHAKVVVDRAVRDARARQDARPADRDRARRRGDDAAGARVG